MKNILKNLFNKFNLFYPDLTYCPVCGGRNIDFLPLPDWYKNQATKYRYKYFGQNDDARLYAHNDYIEKIQMYGFLVGKLGIKYFGERVFKMLGLKETSILYIVTKP